MPIIRLFCFVSFLVLSYSTHANDDLPVLSDSTSSIISLDKEHRLGQVWARQFRGAAPLLDDPITYSYLNDLLWEIVFHSQLTDKRLELLVVDNPVLNAFAVPGGVVGIHGGLFLTAEYEDELASVIAHELAHLSQRHFAAQLEEQRRNRPLTLATMLASILIASADTQAGAAAITSSLAAQKSLGLAFSRQNEREADRIGMQTMIAAGIDPHAMPRMFSRLQKSVRFQATKVPEFLLTHPLSQSRIADSLNRAAKHPKQAPESKLDYQIIKQRAEVHFSKNPQTAYNHFKEKHQASKHAKDAYAFALSAARINRFDEAINVIKQLPAQWESHLYIKLSLAEIQLTAQSWGDATATLKALIDLYPDHYAVQYILGEAYMWAGDYQSSINVLKQLISNYPNDSGAWYMISEAYGKAGMIAATHRSRIEFFLRTARIDSALKQITYARREKNNTSYDLAQLEVLEKETKALREAMKMEF